MLTARRLAISIIAVAGLVLSVPYPAMADIGDISVGGV